MWNCYSFQKIFYYISRLNQFVKKEFNLYKIAIDLNFQKFNNNIYNIFNVIN